MATTSIGGASPRSSEAALRERVKELTCLYGIAQLASEPGGSLETVLQSIADLLPRAWQYPEVAAASIAFDGRSFASGRRTPAVASQRAGVTVRGQTRGSVEVGYCEARPELDEGPFLKEERNLIDAVARQVALIIERRQAEEDKARLQEQLRHADRLATIGQLAAGVAHEFNEPLGSILGFAQLAAKDLSLPEPVRRDLAKIVAAALHAREVSKQLMTFARQSPPAKTGVSLNSLVEDGLTFLESRCASNGISFLRRLAPDLPGITADPAQLNQVLINLVVNAIQAMPNGGALTVETLARPGQVALAVSDTGVGMSKDLQEKIFLPFFTTKDVNQGTGLGLAVVHGIVTGHGGSIRVESAPGQGSRFEVWLPTSPAGAGEGD